MVTIETRHRETDKIIKPASRRYIPYDELEELQDTIEKNSYIRDSSDKSKNNELEIREKMHIEQNKHLDNTKTFKSSQEAIDSYKSKKLD
ncbi:hypothetical protein KAT36_00315 [Candidatus Pacearchaeota archaeon]|nr:hypothetical protein [Candidatus Pacearchaeota archaeon]